MYSLPRIAPTVERIQINDPISQMEDPYLHQLLFPSREILQINGSSVEDLQVDRSIIADCDSTSFTHITNGLTPGQISGRFGSVARIGSYIPEVEPENLQLLGWTRRISDRYVALFFMILISIIIFIINLFATAYGFMQSKPGLSENFIDILGPNNGKSCNDIRTWNKWLHLVINIFSTILLGASNYCAQLLIAPTREEIDTAHAQEKWLDIGVQSFRNLKKMNWKRRITWATLMLSSGLLHFVWNSAVFATIPYSAYTIGYVTSDFQGDVPWTSGMPELVHIRNAAQTLGKLSRQECIDKYTQRNAGLSSLLVVSANITKEQQKSLDLSNPGSSLLYNRTQDDSGSDWAFQPYWLCSAWPLPQHMQGCAKQFLMPKADNWTVFAANFWDGLSHAEQRRFFWSKVDYCLPLKDQEPMNDRCTLRISTVILSFVSALNLLKILCILYTAHLHHRDFKMTLPENRRTGLLRALDTRLKRKESVDDCHTGPHLVTVGDAIVSFLENEDETTKGSLFATKARFTANTPWDGAFSTVDVGERRWFRSATIMRWSITVSLCVLMLGIVSVLLGIAIAAQRSAGMPVDLVSLTRHGLGSAQAWSIVLGGTMRKLSQTPGFFFATFLANIAQVVFSALYILYNNLITVMVVASEWNDFISEKKTLRVSRPRGIQRSAYFLSLPYIFSIPLMCFSGLLHWLISQSIFVIQTVGYRTPDFRRAEELDASSIAYSSLGIILAMVFGGIMVLGLPILGILMKYRPGDKLPYPMPLASTCSAAISANCHRHPEDQDCSKLPVRWGFVKDDSVPAGGRFTFTTAIDVEYPSKEEIERLISLGNRSHAVETGSSHA